MKKKNIIIILGHPAKQSYCSALAEAYKIGAEGAGHDVALLAVKNMTFDPILHEGYNKEQTLEPDLKYAQEIILKAEHLVIIYPLWLAFPPALLHGFIERVFTSGFAYKQTDKFPVGLLKGRSARIIITMGMPRFIYRWIYCAHSYKALKHILKLCGIYPVSATFIGLVPSASDKKRKKWLNDVQSLGASGE